MSGYEQGDSDENLLMCNHLYGQKTSFVTSNYMFCSVENKLLYSILPPPDLLIAFNYHQVLKKKRNAQRQKQKQRKKLKCRVIKDVVC